MATTQTTLWEQFVSKKKNILITTDLEPDDLIALMILKKFIRDDQNIYFLVGMCIMKILIQKSYYFYKWRLEKDHLICLVTGFNI